MDSESHSDLMTGFYQLSEVQQKTPWAYTTIEIDAHGNHRCVPIPTDEEDSVSSVTEPTALDGSGHGGGGGGGTGKQNNMWKYVGVQVRDRDHRQVSNHR